MFVKTIAAMGLVVFLGTTTAAVAQGWQGDNGLYQDRYGLGYTNSARHARDRAAVDGRRSFARVLNHPPKASGAPEVTSYALNRSKRASL
jgi:hypothetical protein